MEKVVSLTLPINVKAQRKFFEGIAIAYGVKRKFLEPRLNCLLRAWNVASKVIAAEMQVDAIKVIASPYSKPFSIGVYKEENGKRSQLFPPWE